MIEPAAGFPVIDDALDLMAPEARDLLHRVDLVIEHLGVPPEHPLVPLLRSLRVRPGEALRMLLAASPERLTGSVTGLRRLADAYHHDLVAPLERATRQLGWGGGGFEAFAADWAAQLRHLAGAAGGETMAARLHATADYVAAVAGWFSQARQATAVALVEAFGSTEAVVLKSCDLLAGDARALRRAVVTGDVDGVGRLVTAAANVGVVALTPVAEWYEAGMEAFVAGADGMSGGDWPTRLADLPPERTAVPETADPGAGGYRDGVWLRL